MTTLAIIVIAYALIIAFILGWFRVGARGDDDLTPQQIATIRRIEARLAKRKADPMMRVVGDWPIIPVEQNTHNGGVIT